MVDKDLLAAKLVELADRIERVRAHVPKTADALRADRDALDIVAFNLMLSVQTCADIASHVVSDEGWSNARSLAEGFTRLEENGVLGPSTASAMRNAVGLRNVVAHGYAGIDAERCFRAATEGLDDLRAFAREVSAWATR
jgi:uncharacterized protein YutE (UPF0331/DUF86 family)